MQLELKDFSKKYYTIGEVAEMLAVNPSLIRFWEHEFDNLNFKKNKGGERRFTQEDINNLKVIYHLVKQKGFTLEGAKTFLKNEVNQVKEKLKMIESLEKLKSFIVVLREEIGFIIEKKEKE